VLFRAQQVARAADLQVQRRQAEPGAELGEVADGRQALAGRVGELLERRHEQPGVSPPVGAAHPAAELVELREAEAMGVVDDDGVDQGNVDAVLDDGGGQEDVVLLGDEGEQNALQLALGHLAVGDHHPRLGHELADPGADLMDGFDPVVDEVDLAVAGQLLPHRLLDRVFGVPDHLGLDREPVLRRRLDDRNVADAHDPHVQRAGNGRGGEGQDVQVAAELFDPLLVAHAEALLLVHDQQAEAGAHHILGQQAVSAHDDVHLALGQVGQHRLLLAGAAKPAEQLDAHGEGGEAVAEGVQVLEGQHRGGREHGHLPPGADRLERGAHGHLGLAVAHVAAEQAIHGAGRFHVALDVLNGRPLVRRLLELEHVFELPLPVVVGGKGEAGGRRTAGVQPDQLVGHVLEGFLHPRARLLPGGAAQAVYGRRGVLAAGESLHQIEALRGDVELGAVGVLEMGELLFRAGDGDPLQAAEDADPMVHVHDVVARLQVAEIGEEGRDGGKPPGRQIRPAPAAAGIDVVAGEHRQRQVGQAEAPLQRTLGDDHLPAGGQVQVRPAQLLQPAVGDAVLLAQIMNALAAAARGEHQQDVLPRAGDVLGQPGEIAQERGGRRDAQGDGRGALRREGLYVHARRLVDERPRRLSRVEMV